jgi:hypothetical protein
MINLEIKKENGEFEFLAEVDENELSNFIIEEYSTEEKPIEEIKYYLVDGYIYIHFNEHDGDIRYKYEEQEEQLDEGQIN